ncbi:gliding motility-associated C-terminal domain-containing protein [Bacteroidales bacterium OttesenSCG-928-B11]|nr:gliding motility-associated C-terminal domain-containing protein [Bacteroidales bacterium OttesenSCG-928-E04]MDL2312849.1 gliding motility-associated C-terminal domain-containing protein [Bacteroidales bacterium OttesenSCG-928-B11]MDL2325851.1 gliding motility-associated C-terminal domain-containing protein [Bacteroidales bacterium OttesenSCG-928-A14]
METQYKIWFLTLLLSLFSHHALNALNAPVLHCIDIIDTDGSVKLTWSPPTDTFGFDHYVFFRSSDGVIFTPFVKRTGLEGAHVDNGIDARDGVLYYYQMASISTSSDTLRSNILQIMDLDYTNSGGGLVVLKWTPPCDPLLASYTTYRIGKKKPEAIQYGESGTTQANSFTDTITACGEKLYYKVWLNDRIAGCKSSSRYIEDTFFDRIKPIKPRLDSVSVNNTTNRICLGWTPSPQSKDVDRYIIYHENDNGMFLGIDTVYGYNNTYWEDMERDPETIHRYRIAAMDSCENVSEMIDLETETQHNMVLTTSLDICMKKAKITWNSYENMTDGLAKYLIYFSKDGGTWQCAGETSAQTTSFELTGLISNSNYEILVRAVNASDAITASSGIYSFLFEATETNDFAYIKYVSVIDDTYISAKVLTSGDTLPFTALNWYRSVGNANNFTLLQSQAHNGSAIYTLQDYDVQVSNTMYYYKVELINECDARLATSNISHNIVLTGEENDAKINNMQWLSYGTWDNGVSEYAIYRKLQSDTVFAKIDELYAQNSMYYSDDVSELFEFGSDFTYYVVATPHSNDYNTADDASISNHIVAKQKPTTWIPNAFNPAREYNRTFRPINSFVDTQNYLFTIWARNGQMVFQTRNPYLGWDGTYNGQEAPIGVYIYHVKYLYPNGSPFEKKGTVTLVR